MTRKDYVMIAEVFARSAGDDLAKFLAVNLADSATPCPHSPQKQTHPCLTPARCTVYTLNKNI